jgi:hypothetical protein
MCCFFVNSSHCEPKCSWQLCTFPSSWGGRTFAASPDRFWRWANCITLRKLHVVMHLFGFSAGCSVWLSWLFQQLWVNWKHELLLFDKVLVCYLIPMLYCCLCLMAWGISIVVVAFVLVCYLFSFVLANLYTCYVCHFPCSVSVATVVELPYLW